MSGIDTEEVAVGDTRMAFLAPHQLLPTEEFIEERVVQLTRDMFREGSWLEPILVERKTLIIMDGHHRREFAIRNSLIWVPCLLLSYSEVDLTSWRAGFQISPEDVIARGLKRTPYPPKTTRHLVHSKVKRSCAYSLSELLLPPPDFNDQFELTGRQDEVQRNALLLAKKIEENWHD